MFLFFLNLLINVSVTFMKTLIKKGNFNNKVPKMKRGI